MTETTTPLQPTTVEPTKLQPTTPAQPNAPTAPDSPHVTETPSPDHLLTLTDLTRQFVRRGTPFDAVSHVNLTVDAGEFIALRDHRLPVGVIVRVLQPTREHRVRLAVDEE